METTLIPFANCFLRANWEEVDRSHVLTNKGQIIWSVDDGFAPFNDEKETEVVAETFSQPSHDVTSGYDYPFPDPDAVLAGFLGIPHSW